MSEINKNTRTPIIDKIEELIKISSDIPHYEVIKLMIKAESNPEFDVKNELKNISKTDDKL